jgi:hypothetical protein
MELNFSDFINIFRDIGILIGVISGVILFVKFYRERPILNYYLTAFHECKEEFHHSLLNIDLSIDNVGDRGTTVRDFYLSKVTPVEYNPDPSFVTGNRYEIQHISPHNSMRYSVAIRYEKLIKEKEIEIEVKIIHTHGEKVLTTKSYLREE